MPRSLREQLLLAQRILEGMQKHGKDADYPTALDTFGLDAARTNAAQLETDRTAAKLQARNAAAAAMAGRTQFQVLLEKMQAQLEASYGKRSPVLFDYGVCPVVARTSHKAAGTKAHGKAEAGKKATGAEAGTGGAGSSGASGSSSGSSGPTGGASSPANDAGAGGPTSGK